MTETPIVLRERALRDVEAAVEHYLALAPPALATPALAPPALAPTALAPAAAALAFIDALDAAFQRMREQPGSGEPRYARELDLSGLRTTLVTGFPYLVFYVAGEADIDVWRILHAAPDIPAWPQDPLED